jgi:formamidopyrimidine-DNA glycosylase
MPELPDIVVYEEALARRVTGAALRRLRIITPFVLRTVVPPVGAIEGKAVRGVRSLGKRIIIELEGDYFMVLHLMVAGRLRWLPAGAKLPSKLALAAMDFDHGTLVFTEAGTRKRASLHLAQGQSALHAFDMQGLDLLACSAQAFTVRLQSENHTLKRALTDPRAFSGIGNAYSDEILHRAKLSPFAHTQDLSIGEVERLFAATRAVLQEWIERLRAQTGAEFPEHVTAFRTEMAVHGKHGQPCPACGAPVQRIVYAENETNYCARCQTGGRILADRSLSRLLKKSWPKSIDELG